MKKYIKFILFLLLIVLVPTYRTALANTINNVSAVVDDSGRVTISGKVSNEGGKIVNALVMNQNGEVNYANSTTSRKNGAFSFTYRLPDSAYGNYKVIVNTSDAKPVITTFSYGSENRLSSLKVNTGTLAPAFSPDVTEYRVTVDSNKSRIRFMPTVSEKVFKIEINGEVAESGVYSRSFALEQKENQFTINVTSLSGQTKSYSITVIREAAGIPSLSVEASVNKNKKVTISGAITSGPGKLISVLVKNPAGKVNYAGTTVSQSGGYYSFSYKLADAINGKYTVEVGTSKLKEKSKTSFYYLDDVYLESLEISDIKLSPNFKSDITDYTATADGSFDSIILAPIACDGTEAITVNKMTLENGDTTDPITLRSGKNVIKVTVQAMDVSLNKTYTITIQKEEKEPELSIKAELNREKRVTISGNIGLRSKRNVSIKVTSPNGKLEYVNTFKTLSDGTFQASYLMKSKEVGTYKVAVSLVGISKPVITTFDYIPTADLSSLSLNEGWLTPEFGKEQLSYSANVSYITSTATISAAAEYKDAMISIGGGVAQKGENTSSIALKVGDNTIPVVVTMLDETKTYNITITRESAPTPTPTPSPTPTPTPGKSSDATLKNIILSVGELEGEITQNLFEYSVVGIPYGTETIIITPVASNNKATIAVFMNELPVEGGASSYEIGLDQGYNSIEIEVTAEDGVTKCTYYISMPVFSPDDYPILTGLETNFELEKFPVETYEDFVGHYSGNYSSEVELEITPIAEDSSVVITINGISCSSGDTVVLKPDGLNEDKKFYILIFVRKGDGEETFYGGYVTFADTP